MKVDTKQVIKNTNQALNDLKNLDASNWSKGEKQEVLTSIEEVMRLGFLAKWKVQKAYLEQFVDDMDAKVKELDFTLLEKTTLSLENILSDIKELNTDIDRMAA